MQQKSNVMHITIGTWLTGHHVALVSLLRCGSFALLIHCIPIQPNMRTLKTFFQG